MTTIWGLCEREVEGGHRRFWICLFLKLALSYLTQNQAVFWASGWLSGKESTCNAGDPRLIPGLGRSAGGGNGNPLQYSCLKNPFDRGAWWVTVHGVAELDITEHSHTQELLYPHGLA